MVNAIALNHPISYNKAAAKLMQEYRTVTTKSSKVSIFWCSNCGANVTTFNQDIKQITSDAVREEILTISNLSSPFNNESLNIKFGSLSNAVIDLKTQYWND